MKNVILFALAISASILLFPGCKKEDEKLPPAITFKTGGKYVNDNDSVAVGRKIWFGIQARGTSESITNLTVNKVLEDGRVIFVKDTAMYTQYIDWDYFVYQNVENKVVWLFTAMDRNRMKSEKSLTIYKDTNSAFGGIYYYPSIRMGYQHNASFGHFLDPMTGKVYTTDSASLNYSKIDILTYYIVSNNTPSPVFSSPGEMDNYSTEAATFYPSISNWTTRNYTLWDISVDDTPIVASDFDNAFNDSLLIVSYHEIWGKKKFKWALTGTIIPFITISGKKGLIKVLNAELADTGSIEFALKIQQ